MEYIVKADGMKDRIFTDAREADLCKMDLTIKGLHPSIIIKEKVDHCLITNKCGKNMCCNLCGEKSCGSRCYDDIKTCKYSCDVVDAGLIGRVENHANINNQPSKEIKIDPIKGQNTENDTIKSESIEVIQKENPIEEKKKMSLLERQERILKIIEELQAGNKIKDIANKYGLSNTRIARIKKEYVDE